MEERIKIWGDVIPYNTGEDKLKNMDIHPEYTMLDMMIKHPGIFGKNPNYTDTSGNDTMVYLDEIQKGYAKTTFDDEPFLIPYLVPGSDRVIITAPGGGYLNKSMDLQRAIRFVRYHASEYQLDPKKIGIIGFSAGGNLCGGVVNMQRNLPVEYPGYLEDKIDKMDATVALAGLIYPVVDPSDKMGFLNVVVGRDKVKEPSERERYAKIFDFKQYIRSDDPAQFICYAKNDSLVKYTYAKEYYDKLQQAGINSKLLEFKKGAHGFGSCVRKKAVGRQKLGMWIYQLLSESGRKEAYLWREAFATWANNIFDSLTMK